MGAGIVFKTLWKAFGLMGLGGLLIDGFELSTLTFGNPGILSAALS